MNESFRKIKKTFIGTLGVIFIITASCCYSYFIPDKVQTVINDTEVKRYNGRDIYLVFTDYGVLENVDAKYRLKFNSSDIQNTCIMLKGKPVAIRKYGWRIRVLSWYENILAVEEATTIK